MLVFREAAGSRDTLLVDGHGDHAPASASRPRSTVLNISAPTPIGRYFFTIRFGREHRSLDRLIGEGQVSLAKLSLVYTLAMWTVLGLVGLGVMVGIYMLKSMAGIDLLDGASFLHDFFYMG